MIFKLRPEGLDRLGRVGLKKEHWGGGGGGVAGRASQGF